MNSRPAEMIYILSNFRLHLSQRNTSLNTDHCIYEMELQDIRLATLFNETMNLLTNDPLSLIAQKNWNIQKIVALTFLIDYKRASNELNEQQSNLRVLSNVFDVLFTYSCNKLRAILFLLIYTLPQSFFHRYFTSVCTFQLINLPAYYGNEWYLRRSWIMI